MLSNIWNNVSYKVCIIKMLGVIIAVLVAYALSIRVEEKMYFLAHVFDPYGYLFMDQMGYSTGKGTA